MPCGKEKVFRCNGGPEEQSGAEQSKAEEAKQDEIIQNVLNDEYFGIF